MHSFPVQLAMILLLAGLPSQSSVHTIEVLDEGTGMTAGALREPFAFIETGIFDLLDPDSKQASIVYLGPVEWDRSGEFTYMLWIQIAPGVGGHPLDDLRAQGTVNLKLDDGSVTLSAVDLSKVTNGPYQPRVPVGQTAYFGIDLATLKRMAASKKLVLNFRAADLTMVRFVPIQETRAMLKQFIRERDIADD
jgi:hypothetical protein